MARSRVEAVNRPDGTPLRVVCRRIKSPVECCGVAILAGSGDEGADEHGLAHFVEHTIFKGTARRRSHHVINRMEAVGGELNAYTTKEETFVYTLAPAGNLARSVELLADLLTRCTFPAAELDKERVVVCEEIDSYLDSPADAVYDDFEDIIFAGTSLGHNILGTKESVACFDTSACRRWVETRYLPGDMVFFYSGPASPERVAQLVTRYFDLTQQPGSSFRPRNVFPEVQPFSEVRHIDTHQAHTVMGCRVGGLYDANRHALALINNILGGPGMNSRLNVALRERRGLVYSVDSSLTLYRDCGLFSVYFGCDAADVDLCRTLVLNEIRQLIDEPLSERALCAARKQYLGQLTVADVSLEQTALSLGRCELRGVPFSDSFRRRAIVESLSASQLRDAAASLLPLSTLTFA